jgi:hypothetical protein
MIRRLQIAALLVMALLFPLYAMASSIIGIGFTLSGLDRWAWTAGCLVSYALLVLTPVAKMIRQRKWRLDALDLVGITTVFCAMWLYPRSVQWYCDRENARRTDSWHWVAGGHGLYYFVDKNYPDAFAGMIEVYPPYFSLPKN